MKLQEVYDWAEQERIEQAEEDKYSWASPIPMWSKADDIVEDLEEFEGDLIDKYETKYPETVDDPDVLGKAIKEYGVKTNIPTKIIVGFEKKLNRDHVERIVRGEQVKSSGELPVVYVIDGAYVVHDGHHRIAANILKGEAQSLVMLYRV